MSGIAEAFKPSPIRNALQLFYLDQIRMNHIGMVSMSGLERNVFENRKTSGEAMTNVLT